jgi:hypothetical protein
MRRSFHLFFPVFDGCVRRRITASTHINMANRVVGVCARLSSWALRFERAVVLLRWWTMAKEVCKLIDRI